MKPTTVIAMICMIFLILPMSTAAHYVIGKVNNAADGMTPDGFAMVLWNPENGYKDRLLETVGPDGKTGTSHLYMFDCHLLKNPCKLGDTLKVQIVKNNGYKTKKTSVVITSAGFDLVDDFIPQLYGRRS